MARRKGRPRRLAPAPKEGPDRKSLVKYVDENSLLLSFPPEHARSRKEGVHTLDVESL